MNIIADVKTWMAANITMYGALTIDNFGIVPESLMIRGDPSPVDEIRYIDGTAQGKQNFSVYARSKSPATAISALDAIKEKLWLKEFPITGALTISVKVKTSPSFVSKDESGESRYVISGEIEYYGS